MIYDISYNYITVYTYHITHGSPSPGAVAVHAHGDHSCALLTGGGIDCWGLNDDGQLGTGDTSTKLTPTGVTGLGEGGEVVIIYECQCDIHYEKHGIQQSQRLQGSVWSRCLTPVILAQI